MALTISPSPILAPVPKRTLATLGGATRPDHERPLRRDESLAAVGAEVGAEVGVARRAVRGGSRPSVEWRPRRDRSRRSTNSQKIVPITLFRLWVDSAFEVPLARSSILHGTATIENP